MEYRLQSMYNHMVGRTASVVSPFYSLLPDTNPPKLTIVECENPAVFPFLKQF